MINPDIPSFRDVYDCLKQHGPATCISTRQTIYTVRAEFISDKQTIVAYPRSGNVKIHEDCWGQLITCQGSRAGGIYNGSPSIFDWYRNNCKKH